MFFEGSEKKAEILVDANKINLLTDIDNAFWSKLVECCHAQILSSIENQHCKAFLLSESSLFVWQDRFLILTCGETHLVNSVEYFLANQGSDLVEHVIYQRKNEYFAQAQPSCFGDDIKVLTKFVEGKAYRFGELDGHHTYIFHQDNHFKAVETDKTYELLAYQISATASEHLTQPNLSSADIRDFLCIEALLPDFIIDDYVFEPYGYSLNAIRGHEYLTIHVTPQADSSYISFESNMNLVKLAPKILAVLQPASFDLLSFNEQDFAEQAIAHIPEQYVSNALVNSTLSNDYIVHFANFIQPKQAYKTPVELDISGENHAL
ncbi:adenosylmethionine decarboxylase [Thalassotalea euphylliae]|uniref:adenosylmethionine decarboxylase n=1 Tax=Thalassotalea euphylliae TaxID=1655234 RepID=UPI00362A455E